MRKSSHRYILLFAILATILSPNNSYGEVIADSLTDWSSTGTVGENNWINGWRNYTEDGEGDYDYLDHFISFLNDGTGADADYIGQRPILQNNWDGTGFRLQSGDLGASGGPWTVLQSENSHPNGVNSAGVSEEHWTIRRWVASVDEPTDLNLTSTLRATNTNCGTGSTVHLYQNGSLLHSLTTNSAAPITESYFGQVFPGDNIDIALTPEGTDGDRSDPCDGSAFRLTISDEPPPPPAPPAIADSFNDWSADGVQGENGWLNGYYDRTGDPDDTFGVEDMILFDNFGAGDVTPDGNHWTGTQWDLDPAGAPWTELGPENTHPNGVNNGPEHWTIRRWGADFTETTPVAIEWQMRESNDGGTGVGGKLFVNGVEVDSAATADTAGFQRTYYANLSSGDIVDLALTPTGPSGDNGDGADGSLNRLTIRNVPDGPLFNIGRIHADSAQQFSGEQGQDGWVYGYFDFLEDALDGDATYSHEELIPFLNDGSDTVSNAPDFGGWKTHPNHWNGSSWDLLANGEAGNHGPWTALNAGGGHPAANGQEDPEVHWVIRRWVADFGEGAPALEGDLVTEEIFAKKSNDFPAEFTIDIELQPGEYLDFAIDPDGINEVFDPSDPGTVEEISDGADGTTFSVVVAEVEQFIPFGMEVEEADTSFVRISGICGNSNTAGEGTTCRIFRTRAAIDIPSCDFDGNGACDVADIDQLLDNLGSADNSLDLNGDGNVDLADRDQWLATAGEQNIGRPYPIADFNLDGKTDAADLNLLGLSWQKEAPSWGNGDVNGDNLGDAKDLNEVGINWLAGTAAAASSTAAVPEPFSSSLILLGVLSLASVRPRKR